MICQFCDGKGLVLEEVTVTDKDGNEATYTVTVPCDACGGCGVSQCCEGELCDESE